MNQKKEQSDAEDAEEAASAVDDNETDGSADSEDAVRVLARGWTNADRPGVRSTRRRRILDHGPAEEAPNKAIPEADPFRFRIYDPADLQRAIRSIITGASDDGFDYFGPEDERPDASEAHLSTEETLRLRRLRQLERDRRGPWRSLIRGTPDMVERLGKIRAQAQHFAPFIDLVSRSVQVAIATGTPLRLPPVLLLGEPGIGKTWALKQVAAAIGSTVHVLPMNMTDSFRIRGLNTAWKGARVGKIAETLLAADTAAPIILLDELEKAPAIDRMDRPFDIWHSLWEPENAAGFVDDYYEIAFRCDRILWIASANSIEPLPDSIRDRLLVLRIPPPDPDQVLAIIDGMYRDMRSRLGNHPATELDGDVRTALAQHTPRRAGKILDLAIGFMAADKRDVLTTTDVSRAADLVESVQRMSSGRRIGFMSQQS